MLLQPADGDNILIDENDHAEVALMFAVLAAEDDDDTVVAVVVAVTEVTEAKVKDDMRRQRYSNLIRSGCRHRRHPNGNGLYYTSVFQLFLTFFSYIGYEGKITWRYPRLPHARHAIIRKYFI